MVVRQRQLNGLIKTDQHRILPAACSHQQQEEYRGQGEYPKVRGRHKGWEQRALTVVNGSQTEARI
jgi:hypothetical protein